MNTDGNLKYRTQMNTESHRLTQMKLQFKKSVFIYANPCSSVFLPKVLKHPCSSVFLPQFKIQNSKLKLDRAGKIKPKEQNFSD